MFLQNFCSSRAPITLGVPESQQTATATCPPPTQHPAPQTATQSVLAKIIAEQPSWDVRTLQSIARAVASAFETCDENSTGSGVGKETGIEIGDGVADANEIGELGD